MIFWLFILMGLAWWGFIEFLRGRANCPQRLSFWLTFLGPIGCITFCILAFVLKR